MRAEAHAKQLHLPFVMSCPENYPKMPGNYAELYDTPWKENPYVLWFCSDDCEYAYCNSGELDYVFCGYCGRRVCEQNPRNGWHIQFQDHEIMGHVCLRCYQEEILENGQPRSDFEGESIRGGIFFSWGNPEPKSAGFNEVGEFTDYFVQDHEAARRYNRHASTLIDTGHKVLTAYERLAIGGLEGYITMMSRMIKEGS